MKPILQFNIYIRSTVYKLLLYRFLKYDINMKPILQFVK